MTIFGTSEQFCIARNIFFLIGHEETAPISETHRTFLSHQHALRGIAGISDSLLF